jgi:hypothetical protein
MRTSILIFVLFIALVAAFASANWAAFTAPTPLYFGVATFEAPLGLLMLGLLAATTLAFAAYLVVRQAGLLFEARRAAKELQRLRDLAERAEASRLGQLEALLRDECRRLSEQTAQSRQALSTELRDHANSLAAMLGELDDRLKDRGAGESR